MSTGRLVKGMRTFDRVENRGYIFIVTPREDLRENRPLDASEFAVHLDHIREERAHPDYLDPARFFEGTYLTKNLLNLSSQVVRRLSGHKTDEIEPALRVSPRITKVPCGHAISNCPSDRLGL
jgi:hypothetical protein